MTGKTPIAIVFPAMLAIAACQPTIAIYRGEGAYQNSTDTYENVLTETGKAVRYIDAADINGGVIHRYTMLYLPDGDPTLYAEAITPEGFDHIRRFVRNGGGLIGIDGGAAFMCEGVYYYGRKISIDSLGLLPVNAAVPGLASVSPPRDSGIYVEHRRRNLKNSSTTVRIVDGVHRITRDAPETFSADCWNESPAFFPHTPQQVEVLGVYEETGCPAMIAFQLGRGRVFAVGFRPGDAIHDHHNGGLRGPGSSSLESAEPEWNPLSSAVAWVLNGNKIAPERRALFCGGGLIAYGAGMATFVLLRKRSRPKRRGISSKREQVSQTV